MSRKIIPAKEVVICDHCGEIILPTQTSHHGTFSGSVKGEKDFHDVCYDVFIEKWTREAMARTVSKEKT